MINYKNIGSRLTDNEFNGIVHLLKKNTVLYDEISLENNNLVGKYANYNFSFNMATILDSGILIKNNSSNLGTIELNNKSFADATYTLKLTVFFKDVESIGFNEDNYETELSIDLEENTPVNIAFDTNWGKIIVGFNAVVIITFNKPLITGSLSKKFKGKINWQDNDNQYNNRPAGVVVNLYADGVFVDNLTVTAADNWRYTFENLDIVDGNNERINYTVNCDPVVYYVTGFNGNDINLTYDGELTSAFARVVFNDNNNERGVRPSSVALTLSNNQIFIANESNGWAVGSEQLNAIENLDYVNYCWKIQEVLGYELSSVVQENNTLVFTVTIWQRPPSPDNPKKGKTAESESSGFNTWYCLNDETNGDEYDEPL